MADERLSPELMERVRSRANDPEKRTDAASIHPHTVSLDALFGSMGPKGEQLRSIAQQLQGLMGGLGGMRVATSMSVQETAEQRAAPPLPAPASADQLAACEKAIGRSLPYALGQLYGEIADGGFGPGGGLFPLERIAQEYDDMTCEPAGPQNQLWPANLIPLIDAEPGYDCLDLDSGEVVGWDPQEIEGYSNAAWVRSFKPLASSLAAWLEDWLDRPTAGDHLAAARETAQAGAMDSHIQFLLDCYAKNPEKRAERGLPEVGWEDEVRRRYGRPGL